MTSSAPWSVKGIGPAAREAAKEQARLAGMTLGEWLTSRIAEEAEDEASEDTGPLSNALDRLASRIEVAETRSTLAVTGIDQSVRGVLARLEAVERENNALGAKFEAATQKSAGLASSTGDRLARIEEHIAGPRTTEAMKVLEGSISRLANQVYDGDGRQRELITEIRRELGAVNARLASMEEGHHALLAVQPAPAPAADTSDLAARVDRAEAATDAALRTLEDSFALLERRLDSTERKSQDDSEALAERLESRLEGRLESRLGEIAANLASGVEAARAEMAEQLQATADGRFSRMDQAMAAMEAHVQRAERRSSQAMERMGHEVLRVAEALNRKVNASEVRAAAAIDRVGEEVARAVGGIDARVSAAESAQVQALEKLGADIARVTERLTERMGVAERRSAQGIDEVSAQLSIATERLNQRLERGAGDFAERIRMSEERTARLLEEARERTERRLAEAQRVARHEPIVESIDAPPFPEARALPLAAVAPQHVIYPDAAPFGQAMAPGFTPVQDEFEPEDIEAADTYSMPVKKHPELNLPDDIAEPAVEAAPEPVAEAAPTTYEIAPDFVDGLRVAPPHSLMYGLENDVVLQPQAEAQAEAPVETEIAVQAEPVAEITPQPAPEAAVAEAERSWAPTPAEALDAPSPPLSTRELLDRARAAARQGQTERPRRSVSAGDFVAQPYRSNRKSGLDSSRTLLAAGFALAVVMASVGGVAMFGLPGQSSQTPSAPRLSVALNPKLITPPATPAAPVAGAEDPAAATMFADGEAKLAVGDASGLTLIEQSANLGHPAAQRTLGGLYKNGAAGVKKDLTEARRWYERAAAGGDRTAMHEAGLMHYQGVGGAKNLTSAAQWFTRAAELGSSDSQYNLGILYEEGYGVSKNPAEAYKWYLVAARDVDPTKRGEARTAADRVKGEISKEAQTAAERIAAEFTPKEQNPSTQAMADYVDAQRALSRLGYYQGLQNGIMNTDLQSAIRDYQRDQKLAVNGTLDPPTVERLAVFVQ